MGTASGTEDFEKSVVLVPAFERLAVQPVGSLAGREAGEMNAKKETHSPVTIYRSVLFVSARGESGVADWAKQTYKQSEITRTYTGSNELAWV